MKLAEFSVRKPVSIAMLIIAIVIFGVVSLPKLSVDLYPELNLPVAVVATSYPGATPTEVEKLVTKPIEEVIGTVSNVKEIRSVSIGEASQVIVQFDWGTDMDQAALDMREKVDLIEGRLPEDSNSPRVIKLDPNAMPVLTMSLSGEQDVVKLKNLADTIIKPRLERVEGVAAVSVTGGKDREIQVVLDPNKLNAYSLTVDQVQQALRGENISGSGGLIYEGSQLIRIQINGEYETVNQIGETPVRLPAGGTVPLKELATVRDSFKDVNQKTFVNEQPSIGIAINKATGSNSVQVADAVFKELDDIKKQLPKNVELNTILDTSKFVKQSINNVAKHAVIGGLLAVFILLLFLNSYRSTLVIAIVIPISVIATFSLMYFTGETINLLTLGGLTLGLGSLVDFAVVVMESIYRHRQEGKDLKLASIIGTKEVGTAVMASALAQIAVFVPIVFVEGLASQLFGPLAMTVVYSHIAALFAAITLVPMMASKLLKRVPTGEDERKLLESESRNPFVLFAKFFNRVSKGYGRLIRWALGHRKTVILSTVLLLGGSVAVSPLVGAEFIPAMDQGEFSVDIEMPNGTKLEETEKMAQRIEQIVKEIPERSAIFTTIGSTTGPNISQQITTNIASVQVKLQPKDRRDRSTNDVVEEIRKKVADIPGAKLTVKLANNAGGPMQAPLEISIRGDDEKVLKDISEIVLSEVKQVEGTRNLKTSLQDKQQEYQIFIDKQLAAKYGIGTGQVISAIRTAFDGQVVTRFRTGDDEFDIKVMYPKDLQQEKSNLSQLLVTSPTGSQVPVSLLAKIEKTDVPEKINRVNQTREVSITGDISGRDLNSVSRDIEARLAGLNLPDGYFIEIGGQTKEMADAFGSLGLAIILSIVLVYMVMASQFESLFHPFVIMFSVPPTFIGVVFGLLVTGYPLSVPALIGAILLVGIVVNNAIVLIDYVNTLRRQGMERNEAILKAGPVRLRPILMTTLTTVLAIIPMAFGGGEGTEGSAPMAVVVVFGLTFSTLITLVLVPVVYTVLDDWIQKRKERKMARKAQRAAKAAAHSAALEGRAL
ncbi:efflux RND transporter permease subunit [Effusibacillus lacus]|uniref:AcrB/AcrD/AcrF family protein n=1 Tax=Effusibacillus lacus TaxID=1348429 RepID=A0A292YEV4_9BACL|nr:efflux RND transporter permease subunit [Effusibacillus lacus]TCS73757.1 HAE1 family hydrophobic/amphiphilic exporter-1 [Effusibacillus lacus]GAX92032.1 AcrB/AcrD/AcrF family protein [Effusibacillus lacus]